MMPNMYIHEQLIKDHCQELLHEFEQQRLLARLRKSGQSTKPPIIERLGAFSPLSPLKRHAHHAV